MVEHLLAKEGVAGSNPVSRSFFLQMDYKTKKKDNASVEIRVNHTAAEVEDAFQNAYEEARKHLKLPGFRKGKVPRDLAEKHLGEAVASEAARGLIARTIRQIVKGLDPPPINVPSFSVESFERGKGASFIGSYDTRPEAKLAKYRKRRLVQDEVLLADDALHERLEEMRRQQGSLRTLEEGEAGKEEDLYTLALSIQEEEEVLYEEKEFRYRPAGAQGIPGLAAKLEGQGVGHSDRYDADFGEEFPERKFAGKTLAVSFSIARIESTELPELNDEFASEVGEYETLEQLRDSIRKELQNQADGAVKKRAIETLIDEIVAEGKYTIPESLVEQEMDRRLGVLKSRLGAKELSMEDLARYSRRETEQVRKELREAAFEGIKRDMTLMEIAQKEGISVGEKDVDEAIRARFGSMLPEEQLNSWMQQESIRDNVEGSLLFERTVDWLFENADIKKGRQISFQEAVSSEEARK